MAGRHTLRRFLILRELIHQVPDPAVRVNWLLKKNPDWDPEETRSWEAWKQADLPRPPPSRLIETVAVDPEIL